MIFTQSYAIGAISECTVRVWARMGENGRPFWESDIGTTTSWGQRHFGCKGLEFF